MQNKGVNVLLYAISISELVFHNL